MSPSGRSLILPLVSHTFWFNLYVIYESVFFSCLRRVKCLALLAAECSLEFSLDNCPEIARELYTRGLVFLIMHTISLKMCM